LIRKCSSDDEDRIIRIINEAAEAFREAIPKDRWHEPCMPREELQREMNDMIFFGYEEEGELIGVMGFQPLDEVTFIRHAYVLPEHQRRGVGGRLLQHLMVLTNTPRLLVGTWEDAYSAIRFYEKFGFRHFPNSEELLRRYWKTPDSQIEMSVVLGMELKSR
jgi:GNAT superfamily N-acetyltransferase